MLVVDWRCFNKKKKQQLTPWALSLVQSSSSSSSSFSPPTQRTTASAFTCSNRWRKKANTINRNFSCKLTENSEFTISCGFFFRVKSHHSNCFHQKKSVEVRFIFSLVWVVLHVVPLVGAHCYTTPFIQMALRVRLTFPQNGAYWASHWELRSNTRRMKTRKNTKACVQLKLHSCVSVTAFSRIVELRLFNL